MNSRMDKYEVEKSKQKSRTDLNSELYQSNSIQDYNKIDLNSNVSVLETDASTIDVGLIREMLDKKYQESTPKRKSIEIQIDDEDEREEKIDTKEYDINEFLAKAKNEQTLDYSKERLKKLRNTNYDILSSLDVDNEKNQTNRLESENELMTLINTITQLEMEHKKEAQKEAEDLLSLGEERAEESLENSFYTGNLAVTDKDYDDFTEIQKDIQSNSILIKVLVFIFIIIAIAVTIFLLNKYLNWELF